MITVLVVDSNKVYARMVANILNEQLKEASVDVAVNIWELRRRLRENQYSLILADLSITLDGDDMADELKKAPDATVVLWSALDKVTPGLMRKPANRAGLKDFLPNVISSLAAQP